MHVGKMMARLNPANVRYDIGHGGTPELTPQDIAAALGMTPAGLGRELLQMVWIDGYAQTTLDRTLDMIVDMQRAEWMRREQQMLDAVLAVAVHSGGETLRRAQRKYADAHAARWPAWVDNAELGTLSAGYTRTRQAVLAELGAAPESMVRRWYGDLLAGQAGRRCERCAGRGHVTSDMGVEMPCVACSSTGQQQVSNRSRARMIQLAESSYRETWAAVYDWTYAQCSDAMGRAWSAMSDAIGDRSA